MRTELVEDPNGCQELRIKLVNDLSCARTCERIYGKLTGREEFIAKVVRLSKHPIVTDVNDVVRARVKDPAMALADEIIAGLEGDSCSYTLNFDVDRSLGADFQVKSEDEDSYHVGLGPWQDDLMNEDEICRLSMACIVAKMARIQAVVGTQYIAEMFFPPIGIFRNSIDEANKFKMQGHKHDNPKEDDVFVEKYYKMQLDCKQYSSTIYTASFAEKVARDVVEYKKNEEYLAEYERSVRAWLADHKLRKKTPDYISDRLHIRFLPK